jgi:hypothetical protein
MQTLLEGLQRIEPRPEVKIQIIAVDPLGDGDGRIVMDNGKFRGEDTCKAAVDTLNVGFVTIRVYDANWPNHEGEEICMDEGLDANETNTVRLGEEVRMDERVESNERTTVGVNGDI